MRTRGFSISKEITSSSEPVTLEMLKAHLQIDFTKHDTLLNIMLQAAREAVETFLCASLIETTITARWEELSTEELPYGPVNEIVSIYDGDGNSISGTAIEGLMKGFVSIKANRTSPTVVQYKAGYESVPYNIQLAIMKLATDNFEHRTGIDLTAGSSGLLPNNWKSVCYPYRRISWAE